MTLRLSFDAHARSYMAMLLILADTISLFLVGITAVGIRMVLGELINPPFYWSLTPLILVFIVIYWMRGLYPAVGLSPVEELKRLTTTTSAVFLILTGFTFWARTAELYSRLVFAFGWILAIIWVPLGRWLLRIVAVNLNLWGEPIAVAGYGPQSQRVVKFLLSRMRFGLRPVIVLDGDEQQAKFVTAQLNSNGSEEELNSALELAGVHTLLLIASEISEDLKKKIASQEQTRFNRLILISDMDWIGSLGIVPYDLEGILGLEIRQNLLNKWDQRLKRILDLSSSLCIGIFLSPFLIVLGMMIRVDSEGPIFYYHKRIGKSGDEITLLKFRTMVENADQELRDYLERNPEAEKEWKENQKLKNDPRVTHVGRFLRKYSLDELPQLWNVIKGEMSLVGPRPIIEEEINHYQDGYQLYIRVRPGMTGLWQVSGRANTTYADRVRFDEYYIRNWSIWMDIYILLRTFWTVFRTQGAY